VNDRKYLKAEKKSRRPMEGLEICTPLHLVWHPAALEKIFQVAWHPI
jgi:hypothetical protein